MLEKEKDGSMNSPLVNRVKGMAIGIETGVFKKQ